MAGEANSSRNKIYAIGVVVFLALISLLYYISAPVYLYIVVYMWFGFLYGAFQQYGRFCFASAWRDLIMVKVPRMFVGIMIGLMTLSIISAWLFTQYPNFYHTSPMGPHELVGGFLFGLGMVFAGGCATGSLYKTGEGNMISLTVLLSLSFAQAIFVALPFFDPVMDALHFTGPNSNPADTSTWHWPQFLLTDKLFGIDETTGQHASFIQNLIGNSIVGTILIGLVFLIGVYIFVVRKGFLSRRKQNIAATAGAAADGGEVKTSFKDELAGFWSMITSSKRTTIAAVALGVIAAIQVFTMSAMRDSYDFGNPPGNPNGTGNFGQVFAVGPEGQRLTADGKPAPDTWPAADPSQATKNGTMFDPGYWYITTQEAMAAAWVIDGTHIANLKPSHAAGGNRYFGDANGVPSPWNSPALLLSFGLILGAAFLALWNKEFKWKFPTRELFIYAVVGGTIMGIGARIALGCNIGAFYTRAAFGSLGGWIFFIGMGIGALVSARIVNYIANKKMAKQMESMDFDIEL